MDLRELEQWYNEKISPIQSRIDKSKQDHNQVINGMLSEHNPYQSPYQQFQQQYPQLDQYGRKVASGGYLRENIQNFDNAMANARGQAFEGQPDTGKGNIMDYFAPAAMTAFHGSPHKFDKFSLEHIGKGEGAQAYGHGLYFAENPKVAGQYQKALARDKNINDLNSKMDLIEVDGDRLLNKFDIEMDDKFAEMLKNDDSFGAWLHADDRINSWKQLSVDESYPYRDYAKEKAKAWEELMPYLEKEKVKYTGSGNLYEVDIPDEHVKNFLDWDAPLSEQPESVQKAIRPLLNRDMEKVNSVELQKIIDDDPLGLLDDYADADYLGTLTGSQVHKRLVELAPPKGEIGSAEDFKHAEEWASDYLNKLGIKGIKYFDGNSRVAVGGTKNITKTADGKWQATIHNEGQGVGNAQKFDSKDAAEEWANKQIDSRTRNLVVFDDSIIKILKRNNEDILPDMLKPQSGDGQPFKQTDKIPEMLKRQSR